MSDAEELGFEADNNAVNGLEPRRNSDRRGSSGKVYSSRYSNYTPPPGRNCLCFGCYRNSMQITPHEMILTDPRPSTPARCGCYDSPPTYICSWGGLMCLFPGKETCFCMGAQGIRGLICHLGVTPIRCFWAANDGNLTYVHMEKNNVGTVWGKQLYAYKEGGGIEWIHQQDPKMWPTRPHAFLRQRDC